MGYSKWIIVVEIGEIIHKDGFYMARQWSYPRNLDSSVVIYDTKFTL